MSGSSGSGSWRLILGVGEGLDPAHGVANMSVDGALLEGVRRGGAPAVRFYRWSPACLSFGRNQPARGLYDVAGARARGIDFVRRPTGGQAVLHADELTYAIAAPVAAIGRPREAYRRINQALMVGLRGLGARVELAGAPVAAVAADSGRAAGPRTAREWGAACFRRPEAGEVVASGRKLVGSAQRMEGRVILQHGSVLLGGSQSVAEELLLAGAAVVAGTPGSGGGWTTLAEELGERPGPEAVAAALAGGFESVLGTSLAPAPLTGGESAAMARLKGRYGSAAWTWRR